MSTPRHTAGPVSTIASHLSGALFLAGIIAGFIVLTPVYAIGALIRRIAIHDRGVPVLNQPATTPR